MNRASPHSPHFFKCCGARGGHKRAKRLTPLERSAIASKAAHMRWGKVSVGSSSMVSIRLDSATLHNPTYLEEILSEGSIADWRQIYRIIADQPFGATAQALEKVLTATTMYGITPLWKALLRTIQGNFL